MRARLGDDGAAVTVRDQDAGRVLQVEDAPGGSDVVLELGLGLLDDADFVPVPNEDVLDTSPAGSIRPGTMH